MSIQELFSTILSPTWPFAKTVAIDTRQAEAASLLASYLIFFFFFAVAKDAGDAAENAAADARPVRGGRPGGQRESALPPPAGQQELQTL